MAQRSVVHQIRRATQKRCSSDEKIRIVLEGLRGEIPVTELCRREGISTVIYYRWSKAFLDAGKNGPVRNTKRHATVPEVHQLRDENAELKRALAVNSFPIFTPCRTITFTPPEKRGPGFWVSP